MTPALKTCPWCGLLPNESDIRRDSGSWLYFIRCLVCKAESPRVANRVEVIDRWNRRDREVRGE